MRCSLKERLESNGVEFFEKLWKEDYLQVFQRIKGCHLAAYECAMWQQQAESPTAINTHASRVHG